MDGHLRSNCIVPSAAKHGGLSTETVQELLEPLLDPFTSADRQGEGSLGSRETAGALNQRLAKRFDSLERPEGDTSRSRAPSRVVGSHLQLTREIVSEEAGP